MATDQAKHRKWADAQIAALVDVGVDLADAQRSVKWVLDTMPEDADPNTWIPTAEQLYRDPSTPEAVQDSRVAWYVSAVVMAKYKRLLDAGEDTPVTPGRGTAPAAPRDGGGRNRPMPADVLPGYHWSPGSQRYRSTVTGRFVARRDILGLLDNQVNDAGRRLGDLTTALHEGRIAPGPWADQMQADLRRLHSQNRALAVGGWDRMTPHDWGAVGGRLRDDYARVQRLATEIQQGTVSLPQALNRVNGYVGNARVQFWNAERERRQAEPGQAIIERRILGIAEHCQDCVDYHDQGWCAAGVLPSPGVDSDCQTHCRCTMEHRRVALAELGDWLGTRRG